MNQPQVYLCPLLLNLPPTDFPIPPLQVVREPRFEFLESYSKFSLAIYFTILSSGSSGSIPIIICGYIWSQGLTQAQDNPLGNISVTFLGTGPTTLPLIFSVPNSLLFCFSSIGVDMFPPQALCLESIPSRHQYVSVFHT